MGKIQKITNPEGTELVVITREDYENLISAKADLEDLEDARDSVLARKELAKIKAGETTLVPHDVAVAIAVKGVHPIRAWRNYRDITTTYLSSKTGITREMITMIETGKRKGTVEAYKLIAKELDITVDALLVD